MGNCTFAGTTFCNATNKDTHCVIGDELEKSDTIDIAFYNTSGRELIEVGRGQTAGTARSVTLGQLGDEHTVIFKNTLAEITSFKTTIEALTGTIGTLVTNLDTLTNMKLESVSFSRTRWQGRKYFAEFTATFTKY